MPELVAQRLVYMHKGKAYVPGSHLASIVINEFKKRLTAEMLASKELGRLVA